MNKGTSSEQICRRGLSEKGGIDAADLSESGSPRAETCIGITKWVRYGHLAAGLKSRIQNHDAAGLAEQSLETGRTSRCFSSKADGCNPFFAQSVQSMASMFREPKFGPKTGSEIDQR